MTSLFTLKVHGDRLCISATGEDMTEPKRITTYWPTTTPVGRGWDYLAGLPARCIGSYSRLYEVYDSGPCRYVQFEIDDSRPSEIETEPIKPPRTSAKYYHVWKDGEWKRYQR